MRRRALPFIITIGVAALPVLASCGNDGPATDESGRLAVAAAFYPLAELVRAVGGDVVEVTTIVPPGEEAHEYEPSPKQLTELSRANIVVILGNGFQPSVEKALESLPGSTRRVDLLESVDTIPISSGIGEAVDESGDDPHVWLSPRNMRVMATSVAEALSAARPGDAATFETNLAAYAAALDELDADLAAGLTSCATPYLVTAHHAFGYLADAYGLIQVSISGISPSAEPSAKTLEDIADFAAEHDVTTIFFEENLPADLSRTVADEIGASTAVLDTIESPSRDQLDSGADYESLMRLNLTALRAGLGCT